MRWRNSVGRTQFLLNHLEERLAPAAGLVPVGVQPGGGLSGKIAYIHGGHGYTADNLGGGGWSFQRGEGFEMIEDLGNVDQMSFLADYLFRAGATVVPLRPVGHQRNEVVIDNDDAGVTFSGSWSNSASTVFYGSKGDVPYRFATSALTETAYARYRPNLPQAGFYPVYAWSSSGGNRAADQLYRITHSGGSTEVRVNHRRVGNGLVYLGTYYFLAGTAGYVDISNKSSAAGNAVIADMIRFGNGLGDIDRGGGISGLAREDEAGLYWVKWHVDHAQGIADSEYRSSSADDTATVGLSPRYAEYMNREADGALSDRVFVSFHSNGGTGTSRGTVALYNGNNDINSRTPNQFLLASSLGAEVNNDLVAQNGLFEHDWDNNGSNVTLDRSDIEFGEINNYYVNDEFDATIVEVAYHDNQLDAELMRDPKVRDAVARATYQGMIKYFRAVDGNVTPATQLPAAVSGVRAESNASGSVTLSWQPPTANSYLGDAATGYRIYASVDGYAWDGGTAVAGGATTSATLTGYDPTLPYFFNIVAVNAGGESPGSEVASALPAGGPRQVLIVNGFDRLGRAQNPTQPYGSSPNTVERVRPRQSNSRDYVVPAALAIQAARPGVRVNSASNEAVISGAVNLNQYDAVIWILGEESTGDRTFDATEQSKVEQFISGGGNLFVSGAEIAWDLDQQNNGRAFFETTLKGNYVADDGGSYTVNGLAGGIFSGLSLLFDNGTLYYNAEFPDVINPQPGAQAAMAYGGSAGNAAIQVPGTAGRGSIVLFGFPFETITSAANRSAVLDRVFTFFNLTAPDLAAPTASGAFVNWTTPGVIPYDFSITYADNVAINVGSLDGFDVRVIGPGGFNAAASYLGVNVGTNGTPRVASYRLTAPIGGWTSANNGVYSVVMQSNQVFDTGGNFVVGGTLGTFTVNVPEPPRVQYVTLNDGSLQRSMVTSLTVAFNTIVTPAAGTFQLTRTGPGGAVGNVALGIDTSGSTGAQTIAKLTWPTSSSFSEFNSLIDGTYVLTLFASLVTSTVGILDGDGDGTPGGDYTTPASGPGRIFRHFGDADGDGDVDTTDFGPFRVAFGGSGFAFDFDNDGDVDASDFAAFRIRFGTAF